MKNHTPPLQAACPHGAPPARHSTIPLFHHSISQNMNLKYFTQPEILQQIGHIRVPKFLDCFSDELKAASITLPAPPDSTYSTPDPQNRPYFDSVAAILAHQALLPEHL